MSPPRRDSPADRWLSLIGKAAAIICAALLAFVAQVGMTIRNEIRETQTTVAVLKDRSDRENGRMSEIQKKVDGFSEYTDRMTEKTKERDEDFRVIKQQLSRLSAPN